MIKAHAALLQQDQSTNISRLCCLRASQDKGAPARLPQEPLWAGPRGVGGASGGGAAGLVHALGPGVEQLGHRVFVRQLQQLGGHGPVHLQQEAVGSCWEEHTSATATTTTTSWARPGRGLTVLVPVVRPVRALVRVVGGDAELQRRDAREVLVI